jgi:NAD(P)-dependent dehydrogenase (short-subunit alcohol dehydrogenase family)
MMKDNQIDSVFQKFSLKNRVALVTGASGHLGREMVLGLASAGAHVIMNGRSNEKLNSFAAELNKMGFEVTLCNVDLLDTEAVSQIVPTLLERFGKLDILVNNAYAGEPGSLSSATASAFSAAYDIAVSSAFHLISTCEPYLERASLQSKISSSIINIASMYGHVSPDPEIYGNSGFNNPPFYGAAKAGLLQLTRYLACHYANKHIRVNSISPGPFPPQSLAQKHPAFYEQLCKKVPLNRIGKACELQGPLLFLASDASSFVTGTDLKVDGGWTAW